MKDFCHLWSFEAEARGMMGIQKISSLKVASGRRQPAFQSAAVTAEPQTFQEGRHQSSCTILPVKSSWEWAQLFRRCTLRFNSQLDHVKLLHSSESAPAPLLPNSLCKRCRNWLPQKWCVPGCKLGFVVFGKYNAYYQVAVHH